MYRPYSFGSRNRANPANRGQQTCKMCARNEYCTYNRRGNHSNCFVPIGSSQTGCLIPIVLIMSLPASAAAAIKLIFF